jgi:hypothetical protein
LQALNLATNTFSTPYASQFSVSENVSIDPNRNLILSPDEDGVYDLFKINADGSLNEFTNFIAGGDLDSAAEDCTTGIALSSYEFTNDVYITDLTQAVFTPGTPDGTWTAPGQYFTFSTPYGYAAGTTGISVAAGTTHLGLVTGEFGGSSFTVFQLPSTSGTGTPTIVDYASALMPPAPDSSAFSAGFDPHTITAYTSPNNGKPYGLMSDWNGGVRWLGVIDLQGILRATRSSSNVVDPSIDLVAAGIVRYIAVP